MDVTGMPESRPGPTVDYAVDGPIATFTIRNPPVNALTPRMHREMFEALTEFTTDPDVRCGILTGDGGRAFCAGDDVKTESPEPSRPTDTLMAELYPFHRLEGADEAWEWESDVQACERYKPIVGAVRGWCLGAGMLYLLALTDIRVAGSDAKFGFPEVAYGMAGAGGMTRLGRQIPMTAANYLLLTGDPVDAAEAHRVHLVNEVVEPERVLDRARALASRIAAHPPLAVRIEMEAHARGLDMARLDAFRYAERMYQLQRLAIGETDSESFGRGRATKPEGSA